MVDFVKEEKKYLFSIIVAVNNTEDYLDECISSVINQTIGFEDNVQLILVDDGSEDDSKNILLKYKELFPNNIILLSQEHQGQSCARNLGLTYCTGKYVNFLDSDDYLAENALEEVITFFNENKDIQIVSIPKLLFEKINANDELNYYGSNQIIDLTKEPDFTLMSVSSTFINYSFIKCNNFSFKSELRCSEDILFINELLLHESKYGVVNSTRYYYRQRFTMSGINDCLPFDSYYYGARFNEFHDKLINLSMAINDNVPNFVQYVLLYDLRNMLSKIQKISLNCNLDILNKIHAILNYIDQENIKPNRLLDEDLCEFFLTLKNKDYKQKSESLIDSMRNFSNKYLQKSVKVSIIIPVYNVEDYLEECLNTVINQSLNDIEIICINDGSKDSSLEILNNFVKKDSRIKIISKINEGQGIARNVGINEAIGEYVGFVDADDYIKEDMFEKLYEKASKNNLDISMCYVTLFDESNDTMNENAWYYTLKCFDGFDKKIFNHWDTKEFTHEISVTPYNKIYKRNLLIDNKLYFAEHLIFEDEVFYYATYLKAEHIAIVPENLYFYRINRAGSTVSLANDNDFTDIVTVFQLVRKVLMEYGLIDVYKKQVYNKFLHYCLLRYSQSSEKYKPNFWKIIKRDFTSIINFNANSLYEYKFSEESISLDDLDTRVRNRVTEVISSNNFKEFALKDSQKLFSIVMAVYNTEPYLDEAILSVINQSIGFVHNIQLILVDDGSTDGSKDILMKYQNEYPDNIIVLSQENNGQASARNMGLEYVKGKYVNFLDSDDYLSYHTLKEVYEFFEKFGDETDVVSIPIIQFGRIKGPHILNYKFSETRVIDLVKEPNSPQLSASSSFFKADALKDFNFPTIYVGSEDSHVVLKVLLRKKTLGVLSNSKYFYRRHENSGSTLDTMISDYNHYTPRLKYHFLDLINYSINNYNEVPLFLQYSLIYDLQWILNFPDYTFGNELELQEFLFVLDKILNYIDNEVILENMNIQDGFLRKHIYTLKNKKIISFDDDNVVLKTNDIVLDRLNIHKLWLDIIEIRDNHLIISGIFNSLFNRENVSILAKKITNNQEEIFVGNYIEYTSRQDRSYLLDTWQYNSNYDISIPLLKKEKSKIDLLVYYHKDGNNKNFNEENIIEFNLPVDFNKFFKITSDVNYITNDGFIVRYEDNSFYTSSFSFKTLVKLERNILRKFKLKNENKYRAAYKIRLAYLILYPFMNFLKRFKSIYLFSDRIEMAGDNAEALFDYAISQKDSNLKYFVIGETSEDYFRLHAKKNIVKFSSRKHKLLYLFADKIISSHPDDEIFDPFFDDYKLYCNLMSSKKYFLQHGVTKDDISNWLRKFDKNISLITAVADIEQESFFNSKNGYDDEIVNVLGFPRYDKLNSNDVKKQILIMPTWVNQNFGENKFKETDYFNGLYGLLHNEKLFELCNQFNYEVIFRPHPMLLKYLDLFETPEFIEIELTKTYSELFNESSLLITDYSSVAFDFAYLKKPVIYYQYYNYYNFDLEKSYFKYELMGFGEVIKDEKGLLNKIEYYLNNSCHMEKKFIERVDNFFKFNDNQNCKRNYDWIKKH